MCSKMRMAKSQQLIPFRQDSTTQRLGPSTHFCMTTGEPNTPGRAIPKRLKDPDLATTELLLVELAKSGADIIELGVPFSDPVADGEVIQRASERALRKGVTLSDIVGCVSRAKQHIDVPIVLFSYFNPLLQFGEARLAIEARRAGIDAVLVTDLIPEEAQSWIDTLFQSKLDPIFLVAPTTSDNRLKQIAQQA